MKTVQRSSEFIYRGLWKVLADWFRVPREPPDLPVREGEYIARFQPGEGWLRYLKTIFWIVLTITDIPLTLGWIAGSIALIVVGLWWVALLIAPFAILIIIGPDILAYVVIHLKYDTTWYVMSERSMRIRRGVWTIRETTITFENVQNVKVQQGPIQRYFGIANLMVETAGGGGGAASGGKHGGGTDMHTGVIEGIANAPELRDRILARLRTSKAAGLGDEERAPDDHDDRSEPGRSALASAFTPAHIEALRSIRDELRRMRTE